MTLRIARSAAIARLTAPALVAASLIAPALLLALAMGGCETRHHENPFDPENPETHGLARSLAAIAGDGVVELRIDPAGIEDLAGFRIVRSVAGRDSVIVGMLPPAARTLMDSAVVNGVAYDYALDVITAGGGGASESLRSASDRARPGPDRPWAIDTGAPPLVALSADARHERARFGEGGPYADVLVNPANGNIVAADENEARLWTFAPDGAVSAVVDGLAPIFRLAGGGPGGTLWALSRETRVLYRLDESGAVVDSVVVQGTGSLRDLDTDPVDGTAWVADALGKLWHFGPGAEPPYLLLDSGSSPFAVAFDPAGRGVWVSYPNAAAVDFWERAPIWHVASTTAGVAIPRDIAARSGPGGELQAWVVDLAGSVALVDPSHVVARSASIVSPRAPVAAPDGSCYVIEGGTGTILHLTGAATIDERLATLYAPRRLAFWWRSP